MMGQDSNIEWTTHTFNPWRGCTKVSAGCANCYAETLSKRNHATLGVWGKDGVRAIAAESYWRQPIAWNKAAAKAGERHRVFCASLADVFEADDTMPDSSRGEVKIARARLFDLIDSTPHLDWLLLTKRPENVVPASNAIVGASDTGGHSDYLASKWIEGEAPLNVWLGTSIENQQAADERIPHLLRVPAAVRFLSAEPMLGPIDLVNLHPLICDYLDALRGGWHTGDQRIYERAHGRINLVIVGGESGPGARPMHPDWVRSLRDQCQAAGVLFLFKQWGEFVPDPDGDVAVPLRAGDDPRSYPSQMMRRVGKKAAGRLLDGREWNEMPTRKD